MIILDSNPSFTGKNIDLFSHRIGLANLAVGVIGLGGLIAGGGYSTMKYRHRATNKFFNSLFVTSKISFPRSIVLFYLEVT